MKQILLAYGFVCLILIALLSVLSYGAGTGYIYVLWRGIQIQTNLWLVVFFFLLLSFVFQIFWMLSKRYVIREKRKIDQVAEFGILHTYEQLGVLWILEGEAEQQDYIQPVFEQSGLLKQIIHSKICLKKADYANALKGLDTAPADAFELAEIQRIEIYLAQQDADQALTHLEFLAGHALSPWLEQVQQVYQRRLIELWGQFAVQFPWNYLNATQYGHLQETAKQGWLSQLLTEFDQAAFEQLQQLQQRYLQQQDQIKLLSFDTQKLWLKLLSRMPEMAEYQQILAFELMDQRFDQEVFHLWFQQQLLKQNPDYAYLEQQIIQFDQKYPSMPILAFSHWHIYMATDREAAALELLSLYPDNILMNYLRIKSTLQGDEVLIQQLNTVFGQDANFIQVKI